MSKPFDDTLYDAINARMEESRPVSESMPNVDPQHIFPEWFDGWGRCAEVAAEESARIAARTQPVPSDEELLRIFDKSWNEDVVRQTRARYSHINNEEARLAGIRAVRAALVQPAMPLIPEGLGVQITRDWTGGVWHARLRGRGKPRYMGEERLVSYQSEGDTMMEALNAAIAAAQGATNE